MFATYYGKQLCTKRHNRWLQSVSLANMTVRFIIQPIAGVVNDVEHFRKNIDGVSRIAALESSNGRSDWQPVQLTSRANKNSSMLNAQASRFFK